MTAWTLYRSPIGTLLLAASNHGVSGLYFEQHKYFNGVDGEENSGHPLLQLAAAQLDEYFKGDRQDFTVPLDLNGSPFQSRVWQGLQGIPYGASSTYQLQARQAGCERSIRAVGNAVGRNPVSIIVPCHRVLRTSGELAGYAGGLERKRYLLALEQRQ